MNHVFIYAQSTSNEKNARMAEIAAVRVSNFGPYKRADVQESFFENNTNDRFLDDLYERIITPEPYVLVSYSKEIVKTLLKIEHEHRKTDDKFHGRAWLDLNDLVWPLVVSGQIPNRKLETLSSHFGVSIGNHSDSSDVVVALMQIYGSLMRRYLTALKGESMIREAGGETLANLRTIIGF